MQKMFKRLQPAIVWAAIIGAVGMGSSGLASPVRYSSPKQLYFEDFDSLPSAPENTSLGAVSWIDDVTLPHWHAQTTRSAGSEGGFQRFRITHGNTGTGAIYSFGAAGDVDRALGSIGSTVVGDVVWGVHLRNDTSQHLRFISIAYYGEQWRDGGGPVGEQRVDFQYSLSGTNVHSPSFGAPVNVDALDFTSPRFGSINAASRDGNTLINRTLISATFITDWQPGTELWLRWLDANHDGNDHALGIDDFALIADVPEPAVSCLVFSGLAIMSRRRRISRDAGAGNRQ